MTSYNSVMSERPRNHPNLEPLVAYANEQERNSSLRLSLDEAESPIVSRLTQAALDVSSQRLAEMTSNAEAAQPLVAAHAELCQEIGARVLTSAEWQEVNKLQETSSDLIPAEEFSHARTQITDTVTQDIISKIAGISEGVIEHVYSEAASQKSTKIVDTDSDAQAARSPQTETIETPDKTEDEPTRRREAYMTIDYEAEKLITGRKASRQKESKMSKNRGSQKVVDRARLLVALSENRGKELSVYELWEEAFGDREFDSRAMGTHRKWLKELRYNNQSIIRHNGEKHPHSAYQIADVALHINHENTQPAELYDQDATVDEGADAETREPHIGVIQPTEHSNVIVQAIENASKGIDKSGTEQWRDIIHQVEQIFKAEEAPDVHYGYFYSLAVAIHGRREFLDAMDVPVPTRDLVAAIEEYAESNNINVNLDPNQLMQRQEDENIEPLTMCRMRALTDLVTRDELMDYVDQYGTDHPVVALLDYVTSLDQEQIDRLTEVISGETVSVHKEKYVGGIRRKGHEVSHVKTILVLPNGKKVEAGSAGVEYSDAKEDGHVTASSSTEEVSQDQGTDGLTTATALDESEILASEPVQHESDVSEDSAEAPSVAEDEKKLSKLDAFKVDVRSFLTEEILPALESIGVSDITDESQGVSRGQLQSKFTSISRSHVKNLAENGHISRSNSNMGLSVKDAIMTILFTNSSIKEQLSNKKYRKAAESVIADYIEKVRVS